MSEPYVIGITGLSGCGKTSVSNALQNLVGEDQCTVVSTDRFHWGASSMDFSTPTPEDGEAMNDLTELIRVLKAGSEYSIKGYDFSSKKSREKQYQLLPNETIIVDGILIFPHKEIRDLLDFKVFLEIPLEVGLERRSAREHRDRGEVKRWELVSEHYTKFILPCKKYTDMVIDSSVVSAEDQAVMVYEA